MFIAHFVFFSFFFTPSSSFLRQRFPLFPRHPLHLRLFGQTLISSPSDTESGGLRTFCLHPIMPPKRKAKIVEATPPDRKVKTDHIFSSSIIKFVVGKDQTEFNVHEAVIAKISDPLRALVTNGMKESVEGKVVWEDVDMDTFTKLLQFAYEHDYTIIDPDEERDAYLLEWTINEQFALVEAGNAGLRTLLSKEFKAECLDEADETGDGTFGDREKQTERLCYHSHDHYMAHVRLYILADRYAVLGLVSLSLRKIRDMLLNQPLMESFFTIVWKLLGFIWPRTSSGDKHRRLLLNITLLCLERAMQSEEACPLLESTPEIAASLMLMPKPEHWEQISLFLNT
ncbi:hypothetical protein LZ31DRAFT_393850 [Colletotrichum somersetense]|nr:hypothetical protein LZ31DRAFT_393850 [Colletotrichum somersetense]